MSGFGLSFEGIIRYWFSNVMFCCFVVSGGGREGDHGGDYEEKEEEEKDERGEGFYF